jgi:hypothetical protein
MEIAITFNQDTGTWYELPPNVHPDMATEVITARKLMFEYIRQLKQNMVYANRTVHKFESERFPWMNKDNIKTCIDLEQYL